MKKVFLIPMVLIFALVSFVACSSDSSGGGSEPEPVTPELVIKLKEDSYKYNNSNPILKLLAESDVFDYYKDDLVIAIDNKTTDKEDILFTINLNERRKRWDVELTGVEETKTCEYTLYYGTDENTIFTDGTQLPFKVIVGDSVEVLPIPEITTEPESGSCNKGETAKPLTVSATIESGSVTYQWYKNGEKISGATSASYTPTEDGQYYVVVSNSADDNYSVKSKTVSVTFVNTELAAPVIKLDSSDAKYTEISMAKELSSTISGGSGTLHYQWYKNGAKFGNEKTSANPTEKATVTPDTFTTYYLVAWNEKNGQTSALATSEIITISEEDIVITVTTSWSENKAKVGTKLSVSATTNVPCYISYQWYSTDKNSEADTAIGETSEDYIPNADGTYFCRVTAKSNATQKVKLADSEKCYVSSGSTTEHGSGNVGFDFNSNN